MKPLRITIIAIVLAGTCLLQAKSGSAVPIRISNDTNRILLLNEAAYNYFNRSVYDSCILFASGAIKLSDSLFMALDDHDDPALLNRVKYFKSRSLSNLAKGLQFTDPDRSLDTLNFALRLMQETGNKKAQASIYNDMATLCDNLRQYEDALENNRKSLEIYRELGDLKQQADQLLWISIILRYMGNYGDGLEYAMESLRISRQMNDTAQIIEALLAMGFTYMYVEHWDDAIRVQQEALEIYEQLGDSNGIARINNDMGATNLYAGNLKVALEQHKMALQIRLRTSDYFYTSASYSYLGTIYEHLGQFDEAINNFRHALEYTKKYGAKMNIVLSYIDLGLAYIKNSQPDLALEQFESALALSRQSADSMGEVRASINIARIHLDRNEPQKALFWLKQAENIAPGSKLIFLADVFQTISETYAKLGDYKNAYANLYKYTTVRDSLAEQENLEKLTMLTNRLEFENKQALLNENHNKMMALNQAEIKRNRIVRNFSLFGMAAAIIMVVVVFIRFIEKKKLNARLNETLSDLKVTQIQLVHAEKMASMGELTAGIAHEIQNPLNFVNNFSEVTKEMLDELNDNLEKGDTGEISALSEDISRNLEKIIYHGKRADSIVKGMLQHSRNSSGKKEPVDLNAMADEYLRLSFHGLRARDKSFHADYKSEPAENLPEISVVPQEIGRVLLNLINNAFYAVRERAVIENEDFHPKVTVTTLRMAQSVEIRVKDNGLGIPSDVLDKIFQPFFTTKPTGEGTGLGLSLSHDIITKGHGGELKVETRENAGTEFIIILPYK